MCICINIKIFNTKKCFNNNVYEYIYKSTKMNKNSKYLHEKTKVHCCEIYKQYMDSIYIYSIYAYIYI